MREQTIVTEIGARLEQWQAKYLNKNCEVEQGLFHEDSADKKIRKIQKKMAALEVEKCQRRFEDRDLRLIEEKINKQKELYKACCSKKGG